LVALIVLTDPSEVARHLASIWLPGLTVSVCLFALAGAIGVAFRLPPGDRIAILFELPCRNLAIAALIGLSVLARPELVYIATAFFLIEAVLLLLIAGVFAARQGRLSSMPRFRPRGERG
jgi:predicted Na+-dependent transporter